MRFKKDAPPTKREVRAADEVHSALIAAAKDNAERPHANQRHMIRRLCRALGQLDPAQLKAARGHMEERGWTIEEKW